MEAESLAQNSATGLYYFNHILPTAFIQYFCNTHFNEFCMIHNLCTDGIYVIVTAANAPKYIQISSCMQCHCVYKLILKYLCASVGITVVYIP